MLEGTSRIKVYNKTAYAIGLTLVSGLQIAIRPGSFQLMTVDDMLYVESTYPQKQFFSGRKLVAVDNTNKEVDLSEYGFGLPEDEQHKSADEIIAMLKQSPKKIEAWLDAIDNDAELHGIYIVAKEQDLPASKLKILATKIKDKDWLDEFKDE